MNGASDNLLARAGFVLDQRYRIAFRDDANLIQYIYKCRAAPHHIVFHAVASEIPFKHVLYLPLVFFARGLGSIGIDLHVHANSKLSR